MNKFTFKCTDGIRIITIEVRDKPFKQVAMSAIGFVPDIWAKQWCKIHRLEFINLVPEESVTT